MAYIGAVYECLTGDDWVSGHLVQGTSRITVFDDAGGSTIAVSARSQYSMLNFPLRTGVADGGHGKVQPFDGRGFGIGNKVFWYFTIDGVVDKFDANNQSWGQGYVLHRVLILDLVTLEVKLVTPIPDAFVYGLPGLAGRTHGNRNGHVVPTAALIGSDGNVYMHFQTQPEAPLRNVHYLSTVRTDGTTSYIVLDDLMMNGAVGGDGSHFEFLAGRMFVRHLVVDNTLSFPTNAEGYNVTPDAGELIQYIRYLNPATGQSYIQPTGWTFPVPSDAGPDVRVDQVDRYNLLADDWGILYDSNTYVPPDFARQAAYDRTGRRYGYFNMNNNVQLYADAMNTDNWAVTTVDADTGYYIEAVDMWKRGMDAAWSQFSAAGTRMLFPELGGSSGVAVDVRIYAINGGRYIRSVIYDLGGTNNVRRRLTVYQSYEAVLLAYDSRDPGQFLRDEPVPWYGVRQWDDWDITLAFVEPASLPYKNFWSKFRLTSEKP